MLDKVFVFLLCFYFGSAKIKITNLNVPQSIELGSVSDIILDCDFEANDESGIEVKWFYNGLIHQVYQWIPETGHPPQALGRLKNIVDLGYKITGDKDTMFRALHITNVSLALTGNYSCKVSGERSEDVATKPLTVYEPADSGLQLTTSNYDIGVAFCEASGIYPEPDMKIYITNENQSVIYYELDDADNIEKDENGYNITMTIYFSTENITSPIIYVCELEIPGTNYSLREEKVLYFDDKSTETQVEIDEDILNFNNLTNSTETFFEDSQESSGIETQIEDDLFDEFNISTTATTINYDEHLNEDFNSLNDNDAYKQPPNISLVVMLMLAALTNTIIRIY